MLDFTRSNLRNIVVSAAGAVLFSAVCIGGAVAPAQAAIILPVTTMAAWEANAVGRVDADLSVPTSLIHLASRNAQIGVTVDHDGSVSRPVLLQSSGSRRIDRMLLRQADAMTLAALPDGRTTSRPVILRVQLRDDGKWAQVAWPTAPQYAAR